MTARTVELMGAAHVGIGSDLCQDQPDSVVEWMRVGRWTKQADFGEGSAANPGFPAMPSWFGGNLDFGTLAEGLAATGLDAAEIAGIMGGNWARFFDEGFGAAPVGHSPEGVGAH
jgi:microsomal dipeptidase-like Zn-dependent dipeptidase